MRERPPEQLVALVESLGLATATQVARLGRRVRTLAKELPSFESVWIDAMVQARLLTRFQAAAINNGRGESLAVGPYVLSEPLPWPQYVDAYRAFHMESRRDVRLVVLESLDEQRDEIAARLQALTVASDRLRSDHLALITDAGADTSSGGRFWAATDWIEGRSATEWMVHNGRFQPEVVLEIAREMVTGLEALERAGLCHGDVCTAGLTLTNEGRAILWQPGLRAMVRPHEGFAQADLCPEAYDYLAPERVSSATHPNMASDIYACGCVWWHMLCGRTPLGGGNSLAKLRAAQEAKTVDVRRFAPNVPGPLAIAVSACLRPDPSRRPDSISAVKAMLGRSTRCGRVAVRRDLANRHGPHARKLIRKWSRPLRRIRQSGQVLPWITGVAGCLVGLAALTWAMWRPEIPLATTKPSEQSRPALLRHVADGRPLADASKSFSLAEPPIRTAGLPVDSTDVVETLYEGAVPEHLLEPEWSMAAGLPTEARLSRPPVGRPRSFTTQTSIVLPCDQPVDATTLVLRPRQRVHAANGGRATVIVPPAGLLVRVEGVRFENIDFRFSATAEEQPRARAFVELFASGAQFSGCTFESPKLKGRGAAALLWAHPAEDADVALSLPSGRLDIENCMFSGVSVGIECRTRGALAIVMTNTLHRDTGPVIRLDHCPRPDEPLLLRLQRVTARQSGPLLSCNEGPTRYHEVDDGTRWEGMGEIEIESVACVFCLAPDTPLLHFLGPVALSHSVVSSLCWSGQGSLVTPGTPIAACESPDGEYHEVDDSTAVISGLVISEVEFSASNSSEPDDSRILRWQAPLQSTEAPGINVDALP